MSSKTLFAALTAALLACADTTLAADPRLRTVTYQPDAVVDVPVRRGQITQIVLGADETIVGTPMSGMGANCAEESHTWCVALQGRDLFVKPKSGATSNNLIVTTDRRRHVFALHPVDAGRVSLMRLTVGAPTPPPPPMIVPAPSARELLASRWPVKAVARNADYSVAIGKHSEDIIPVLVFDDGTQTYFGFPNNRPLPVIFQTGADGSEEMVNAAMGADDLLVADRVARRFVLRLGDSVVSIINEAFDIDGVAPVRGTTVPGVARVLKPSVMSGPAPDRPSP